MKKLHEAFAGDFDIGAAVNPRTIAQAGGLIAEQFNSLTAENEMKFASVHPSEDVYTFDRADEIVAFAKSHGQRMRGHTLVWHNQTTEWVFRDTHGGPVDKTTLLARMKSHIDTVVGRYKNDVYCWDVVNEAVTDDGSALLRTSPWLDIAGEDFIAKAFEYAHEADPKALLFYNDYNECDPGKRERIYALVRSLKERGAPIHGIGLQAHWSLASPTPDAIRASIERYAQLGLKLHVTEMDISVFEWDDRRTDLKSPTAEMLARQEERYDEVFRLFREYREFIASVTFWGAADDYTWLDDFPVRGRKNWPFLFDEQHRPKASFDKVAGLHL
ncbi:endo-1,4-beta-xylanase [Cohnella sp. GCM10027633]|uniref:endo-1,4-beta-xylanase n=1 Tax=unclassified Cohnella TaxID=2636738 RepID=UPI00363F0E3A